MDSKRAREIAVREAEKIRGELPVCYGCPEGRFEESVDRWLKKLCNMMRQVTFLEWRVVTVGAPPVMFVLSAEQKGGEQPFLEVPIARVDGALSPERKLAIIGLEADEVRKAEQAPAVLEREVAERDRIGELLEGQARLEQQINALHSVIVRRDSTLQGMIQRTLLLVHHFGRAPWFGKYTDVFGRERDIFLERPGPDEEKLEPTKKAEPTA